MTGMIQAEGGESTTDSILDAVSPLERVRLSGTVARLVQALGGQLSSMERIKSTRELSDALAQLGVVGDDGLSDDPNSPNYRYKDTGYIADSRKERAANMIKMARQSGTQVRASDIDWDAIEKNPREAAELITKSNLFGKTDWDSLRDGGMEPGAGFLIDRVYASIAPEPATDGPFGRKDYALALDTIRKRLEVCRTPTDVTDVLAEIRDELEGSQLNPNEADEYAALQAQYDELSAIYHALRKERDALGDAAYKIGREISKLEYEQNKRLRRKWKPDPAINEKVVDLKAEYTAALERVREWDAEHPEFKTVLVSETLGTSGNIERVSSRLSSPLRDRMSSLSAKMREIVRDARIRNVSESPLTRGWVSFGKKFLDLLNYRRHGGSQAFSGHVTNAKSGRIKDWSWAEKEKATPVRKATKEEVRFQMRVAENFQRKGGKPIKVQSTAELKDLAGLRDIQSGNWVLKDPNSAKFHVEQTAAAMSDMSDILGIPMKALGLGGRLAIAFGARGSGAKGWKGSAPRAHYEPKQRVINLTKMGGGGALAHEFFHAIDDIAGELATGKAADKPVFATSNPDVLPAGALRDAMKVVQREMMRGERRLTETYKVGPRDKAQAKYNIDRDHIGPVAQAIKNAGDLEKAVIAVKNYFGDVSGNRRREKMLKDWIRMAVGYYAPDGAESVRVPTGQPVSNFYAEAVILDGGEKGKYWSSIEEMGARAFQAYIEDRLRDNDRQNDYLSAFADNKYHVDPILGIEWKPFPEGAERERINAALDDLFKAFREQKVFESASDNKPLLDAIFGSEPEGEDAALDAVNPIERVRLGKSAADILSALEGKISPLDRLSKARELSAIIAQLADTNKPAAPAIEIPADARLTEVTFTVTKVGRKWIEVKTAKGYKNQLAIGPGTDDLEVGKQYTMQVMQHFKSDRYGTTVTLYPVTQEAKDRGRRTEIMKWLGYVEEKVPDGYLYQNGIDKLKQLGVEEFPDLKSRLDTAIDAVRKKQAEDKEMRERQKEADLSKPVRVFEDKEKAVFSKNSRVLFPLSSAPEGGATVKWRDRWVVFTGKGKDFRIGEDAPSLHGSHLLGHEGRFGAYFYYRDATQEEISEAEKAIEAEASAQAAKDGARKAKQEAAAEITSGGVRPDGMVDMPDGEVVGDTFDIYGGGERFVIQPDRIWYIRNNGMDGDNWENNNIRTGGAGAIGWYVPFDEGLAAKIRQSTSALDSASFTDIDDDGE